jgi:hypothetical protein
VRPVNAVLQAEEGRRDWPLRFYSADLLFSTEARLAWVEPDLAPLPKGRSVPLKRRADASIPHPARSSPEFNHQE